MVLPPECPQDSSQSNDSPPRAGNRRILVSAYALVHSVAHASWRGSLSSHSNRPAQGDWLRPSMTIVLCATDLTIPGVVFLVAVVQRPDRAAIPVPVRTARAAIYRDGRGRRRARRNRSLRTRPTLPARAAATTTPAPAVARSLLVDGGYRRAGAQEFRGLLGTATGVGPGEPFLFERLPGPAEMPVERRQTQRIAVVDRRELAIRIGIRRRETQTSVAKQGASANGRPSFFRIDQLFHRLQSVPW